MLREDVELVRQIVKEEIAKALVALRPIAKVAKPEINPEPAPEPVKAEAPVKKGK